MSERPDSTGYVLTEDDRRWVSNAESLLRNHRGKVEYRATAEGLREMLQRVEMQLDAFKKPEDAPTLDPDTNEMPDGQERKTIGEWNDSGRWPFVVMDPDGFDRKDPHLWERRFTAEEFEQGALRSTCLQREEFAK